eukprot:m51a1_g5188 hypothetical protein (572) ;mRNA; r:191771-193848
MALTAQTRHLRELRHALRRIPADALRTEAHERMLELVGLMSSPTPETAGPCAASGRPSTGLDDVRLSTAADEYDDDLDDQQQSVEFSRTLPATDDEGQRADQRPLQRVVEAYDAPFIGESPRRLLCEMVAGAVLTLACMAFVHANAGLCVVVPVFAYLVAQRKTPFTKRKHVHPYLYNAVVINAVVVVLAAALNFSLVFWWPATELYETFGKAFVPATYPFFLAQVALTTVTYWKMRSQLLAHLRAKSLAAGVVPVSRFYSLRNGKVLPAAAEGDRRVAVFVNPSASEQREMAARYGLDARALAAVLDPSKPVHLAAAGAGSATAVIKVPHLYTVDGQMHFTTENVGLFVCEDRLVVVLLNAFPLFEGRMPFMVNDVWDAVLVILERSVKMFEENTRLLQGCSDEAQESILETMANDTLMTFFRLEKSLVLFTSALTANHKLLTSLAQHAHELGLDAQQQRSLCAVLERNKHCKKETHGLKDVLTELMDSRAAIVANNLNTMMTNLTAILIGHAVVVFGATVGGMSEFGAWLGDDNQPIKAVGFSIFCVLASLAAVGFFVFFRLTIHWWDK